MGRNRGMSMVPRESGKKVGAKIAYGILYLFVTALVLYQFLQSRGDIGKFTTFRTNSAEALSSSFPPFVGSHTNGRTKN